MSGRARVLVVAWPKNRDRLVRVLQDEGHELRVVDRSEDALPLVNSGQVDVVVMWFGKRARQRFSVLRAVRQASPGTPVVVVAELPSIAVATQSIRLGAVDCLSLPAGPGAVQRSVEQALAARPWLLQRRQHQWSP